jgi:hypothetical protein
MDKHTHSKIQNECRHIQFARKSELDYLDYKRINFRNLDNEIIDEVNLQHDEDFFFIKLSLLYELKYDDETVVQ